MRQTSNGSMNTVAWTVRRRVLAVLRQASRIVGPGRRRTVGRLVGAAGVALACGLPTQALAVCTGAAGTYTCSGIESSAQGWSAAALDVTLDSTFTNPSAITGSSIYLYATTGGSGVTFDSQAGSSDIGTSEGVYILNYSLGAVTATVAGDVEGTTGYGFKIYNDSTSTDASFTQTGGTIIGETYGLLVENLGTGDTTVDLSGTVTGTTADGVSAFGDVNSGTVTVIQRAGTIMGQGTGILARALGHGDLNVTTAGTVIGTTGYGLNAYKSGAGNLIINQTAGSITGNDYAIYASYLGTGWASLALAGDVTATSSTGYGVYATMGISAGDLTLDQTAGTITGGLAGIRAVRYGSGDITMTLAGDVTGTLLYGLYLTNYGSTGDIAITQTGGTISGAASGMYIANLGSGATDITVRGTVSGGASSGIFAETAATISNYGTISGGTDAIYFYTGGNTLNIYDGAVFAGGVNFNWGVGNTVNFYTGSYTLGVKGYDVAANTINLLGSAQTLVTSGVDSGTGDGNIYVVGTSPASAVSNMLTDHTRAVFGIIGDIQALDVSRPIANPGALGYGPEAKPNPTDLQTGGQTFDAYGNLAWVRALGAATEVEAGGGRVGSSTRQYGLVGGIDHAYDDWRIGLFGGGAHSRTSMADGSGWLSADLGVAGLYARYALGGLTVDASIAGGSIGSDMTRLINGGAETATGSFGGRFGAGELALSTRYALGPSLALVPSLKARYTAAYYDSFTESGSSQNISYDGHLDQSLEQRLETRLAYDRFSADGSLVQLWAKAGVSATEQVGSGRYGATVVGTDFTVETLNDRVAYGATAGLGFDATLARNVAVFGSVEGTLTTDRSRTGLARAGVKIGL